MLANKNLSRITKLSALFIFISMTVISCQGKGKATSGTGSGGGGSGGGSSVEAAVITSGVTNLVTGTDFSNFTFQSVSGAKYQCRTALSSAINAASWAYCDGGTGSNPTHDPTFGANGTYTTQVRLVVGSDTGAATSTEYYVHNSLDGATACNLLTDNGLTASAVLADAATKITNYATSGTFMTNSDVVPPSFRLGFDIDGNSSTDDYPVTFLSLRRKVEFSSNRKLALFTRTHRSRFRNDCYVFKLRIGAHFPAPWGTDRTHFLCAYTVMAANGNGICYTNTANLNTYQLFKKGHRKINASTKAYYNTFSLKTTSNPTPPAGTLYLPP